MASTNGSQPVDPTSEVARARTSPTQVGAPISQDPEVLAAQIERTREDLAETLDAIADRVSPKRVATRTRGQVLAAVEVVKGRVQEQIGHAKVVAAGAKQKAVAQAGAAKEVAAGAKQKAVEQAGAARERVQGDGSSPTTVFTRPAAKHALPPVTAVAAQGLDLSPSVDTDTVPIGPGGGSAALGGAGGPTPPPGLPVRPEALAGGVLALLVLLLVRRRRRARRRALQAAAAVAVRRTVKGAKGRRRR